MATNNGKNQPTGASGKVMQGQGVGTACNFSTATYPSTATGTGKILRADGTNWAASTATYPDTAGTSGNVLTSDGTNWNSTAAGGGSSGFNGNFYTVTGNPADSTTYYMWPIQSFTVSTADIASTRIYAPAAFTLNTVVGTFNVAGTAGSSENCTFFIRKNNTSNTNLSTTIQLNTSFVPFNFTSIGLSFAAGDFFSFGFTGAAWATNPTSVVISLGWSS